MNLRIGTAGRLVLAFIVLAALAHWLNYRAARDLRSVTVQQRERDKINSIARLIQPNLQRDSDRVTLLASLVALQHGLAGGMQASANDRARAIASILDRAYLQSKVDALEVTDAKGIVLYRAHNTSRQGDLATAWGVDEALAGKGAIGSTRDAGVPIIRATEPIFAGDKVVGTVSAGIRIGDRYMHNLSAEVGAELALIDRSGKLVAASAPGKLAPDAATIADAFHQKIPIFRANELTRTTLIYLPLLIVDDGWVVMAEIDSSPAFALLKKGDDESLLVTLILVAGSILITFFVLPLALRPLHDLRNRAERMVAELTGKPVTRSSGDDIASVVQVLNTLTNVFIDRTRELMESEHRYRTLIDWIPEPFFVHRAGNIVFANPAAIKLFGAGSAKDLVGKRVLDRVHPDSHFTVMEGVNRIANNGGNAPMTEMKFLRLTGTSLDVEVQGTSITYGGEQAIHTAIRDITARKKAETARATAAQRLELALDGSQISVWETDLPSGEIWLDAAWAKFLGYPPTETRTTFAVLLALTHPQDQQNIASTLAAALKGGQSSCAVEHRVKTVYGTWRWNQCRGRVIERDANGRALRISGTNTDITERKIAEAALREGDEIFRDILQTTVDGFWRADAQGKLLDVNIAYARQSGYTREELMEMSISDLDAAETAADTRAHIKRIIEDGSDLFESVHRRKDGSIWHVEVSATYRETAGGQFLVFLRDITERKISEASLHQSKLRYDNLVAKIPVGIYQSRTTPEGAIRFDYVSPRASEMFNASTESLLADGRAALKSIHPEETDAFLQTDLEATRHRRPFDWTGRFLVEGVAKWLHIVSSPELQENGDVLWFGLVNDVTERRIAEEQIQNLAFYDPLTGLPNRRLLTDRLKHALAAAVRHRWKGALLFVDLDHFKTINDTLGHYQGDLLLEHVARRLTTCIREGDTAARLGGDEFVVMLEDLSENPLQAASEAEIAGKKILEILGQTYHLASYEYHSTASMGVTLFGDRHESIDEPFKRADLAMYEAKNAGRNTLRFFDPQMQAAVSTRAVLETSLRKGIHEKQFLLYYQAQVTAEGRIAGVEVLVRWRHPQHGISSPGEFIRLAEETGLVLPLGRWVMEGACSQLAVWAAHSDLAHLSVSVNVSARQFRQADFVDQLLAMLDRTGANPRRLKLELTESLLVTDFEDVIAKMFALKERGISFSLDDFGTGYSSLSYLKRLPLDQLKIDQVFVKDILIDRNVAAIAKMVVALAGSLGLAVIAEGVENDAQRAFLADLGCLTYQGYLFCRPLPVDEFEEFVKDFETY